VRNREFTREAIVMWDQELDAGKLPLPGKAARGSPMAANLFSLVLGAYLVAWVGLLVFTMRTFGDAAISLLTLIPLVVGARLRYRWPRVQGKELVFLLVVVMVASGGAALVLWHCYDQGLDVRYAIEVKWVNFENRVRHDPAFRGVVLHQPHPPLKSWYGLSGTVASQADLDRLRALAVEYGVERPYETPDATVVRDVKIQDASPRP
jgi:hypothetical protein